MIPLVLLGPGNVGGRFLDLFYDRVEDGVPIFRNVRVVAVFGSSWEKVNKSGITKSDWQSLLTKRVDVDTRESDAGFTKLVDELIPPFVVVDTTASESIYDDLVLALRKGAYVISANKKPYTRKLSDYGALIEHKNRIFAETTVGAGLPIVGTIKGLVGAGDQVLSVEGCFSGTLGYIFSKLDEGYRYSEAVREAYTKKYTEPDPRDDLGGMDVARKALILNRIIGGKIELGEIAVEQLFPESLQNTPVEEFLKRIEEYDEEMEKRVSEAGKRGMRLRYVASVKKKKCEVGIREVDSKSDIGSLRGPDNIAVIGSKWYSERPLVIKGPGAGVEVTSGGVMMDLVKVLNILEANCD